MSNRTTLKTYFETGDKPTEVQFADLIDSMALLTEVDAKQDTLVSGTNIKTINSTSLLGSGDIEVQSTLVSGTNIKTINLTSLLGSGDIEVQSTLVSGTNIKTINSTSLLGSGDIEVQSTLVSGTNIKTINGESILGSGDVTIASLSVGTDGQIPFVNATNDDLAYSSGLHYSGTELYAEGDLRLQLNGQGSWDYTILAQGSNTANIGGPNRINYTSGYSAFSGFVYMAYGSASKVVSIGNDGGLGARLGVKGRGTTTQATFLLTNSADTELLKVLDNGTITDINGNTFHSLGTDGQIPFTNVGGTDLDYSANLHWDSVNSRLGIGTTTPSTELQVVGNTNTSGLRVAETVGIAYSFYGQSSNEIGTTGGGELRLNTNGRGGGVSIGGITHDAKLSVSGAVSGTTIKVKGSGTTSATTTFLAQNSDGDELFKVLDDGVTTISNGGVLKLVDGGYTTTVRANSYNAEFSARRDINIKSTDAAGDIYLLPMSGNNGWKFDESGFIAAKSNNSGSIYGGSNGYFGYYSVGNTHAYNAIGFDRTDNNNNGVFLQYENSGTHYVGLKLTEDGNVGIGVTPTARLHVKGSGTTSATTALLLQNSGANTLWLQQDIGNIGWGTSDVENWHTSFRAIEGNGSTLWRSESTAAEVFIGSIANAYYPQTGGWKYKHSKGAAYIFTGSTGGIKLRTAPSGTTNASLTWVDVLHAKTNGNLNLPNLPTSSSGLASGDLWNNSGVINIV